MSPSRHVICLLAVTVGVNAFRQQPIGTTSDSKDTFDPSFDHWVEDLLKECHTPGVSIAVVEDGRITSKGYGFATLPDQRATADTQYFTASTTKAFTAAAAALLVHDDESYPNIRWTTPINSAIRGDFVLEDEWATNHITIEDALSHRTGLAGHDLFYGREGDTPSTVTQRLRYLPMTAEPRTEWQYCNVMFGVVTNVIQTITGRTLGSVLKEWIWEPLGMRSTTFTVPDEKGSRLARGYYWNPNATNDDDEYIPERRMDLLSSKGDGATISTVNDYALWMKALINAAGDEEDWNSSSPISRTLFRDVVTPRAIVPVFDQPDAAEAFVQPLYALGWFTAAIKGYHLLAHSGGVTGFGTELYMLPGMKYGVVTMQNRLSRGDVDPSAIIASRLIVKKLGWEDVGTVGDLVVQKEMLDIRKATRQSIETRRRRTSSSFALSSRGKTLPLPLPLCDLTGLYTHPAYGPVNLTISPSQILEGLLHNRTWLEKQVFAHVSGTLFSIKSFEPHGLGDVFTGEGVVWEDLGDDDWEAYAVFELGADGQSIDMLGMELDPDMIEHVRAKGSEHWREGMIWFNRVR